ncbi:dipicolinate synthase subunit DpsA [Wansuia hejianensis]|uniref:Dipicolinate synthase subunit DpsA n=1 Tax=Wansuia hejianensis TaxID=2763667 RepID=A0A926EWY4_9FIRM|nr:dipicolinate synthase subunit DpsA [Wansuia hejianensis]MBC8591393.1 dipicolinate synthase subunit DpsA [Wansuia hejianensis]
MNKKNFTVLGGDSRSLALGNLLSQDGHRIIVHGFDDLTNYPKLEIEKDLKKALEKSDIIIGPLPFTKGDRQLNTPLYSQNIDMEKLLKDIPVNKIFMGGAIPDKFSRLAYEYGIHLIDYFKREEMQVLNAIPTAEGAIQIAMEEINITLHGSKTIILGYGRIGKVLTKMLKGIGANVYVGTRNYSHISWIKAYDCTPVLLKELDDYLPKMDIIFNTIPSLVLQEENLKKLKEDTLIIDVASKPGGIDFKKAEELGINTIWALGLPGKVAPITAASCIKETIYNIIEELEV